MKREIPAEFLSPYNPSESEKEMLALWEKSGYTNPDNLPARHVEPFTIVLPPPNVTGILHIGHALMVSVQDIMVRFERMRGKKALWLPGTDHAGIATQSRVEKNLEKEKVRRQDLGRTEFLKRVEQFAQESHDTIATQVKEMGASVDWSREAYTLDADRNLAVRTAFKKMYDDGLIYRGYRIVNWDPKGQTVISDDEIEYIEEKSKFYYFKYGPFVIGTARPETKFGDKYVVMHPEDTRYAEYTDGQKIELEWINGSITATIIKDESIDMAFGTGVMTITPWHSHVDFDIAQRHKLDKEQIIDKNGKMLPIAGEEFAGLKIKEAREKVVEKLRSKGLIEKEEEYVHNIAVSSRGGGTIEPQIMNQWFVDVNKKFIVPRSKITGITAGEQYSLKELMIASVRNGQINIVPERFNAEYFRWIENLRDWCISRQIWFGHRIPVWYKAPTTEGSGKEEIYCGIEAPTGEGWVQDEDTLDTWFSSGLWTFSTLGWPDENAPDFKQYHPTNMLETGADIIFFWVARMILMSTYLIGDIPFKNVYFHGLVRDGKGQKISKSLGNNIDPRDMSAKFGTDALRMGLIIGTAPGADSKMSEDKARAYKNFANKIWNASRFVLDSTADFDWNDTPAFTPADQALADELGATIEDITRELSEYHFHLAGEKLYDYFWKTFADKIIEESKPLIADTDMLAKMSRQRLLVLILTTTLKALHPFIPFVTEAIWQKLPEWNGKTLLMIETWPSKVK